jgi:hypothetical protein
MPERGPVRQQAFRLLPLVMERKIFQAVAGQKDDKFFEFHDRDAPGCLIAACAPPYPFPQRFPSHPGEAFPPTAA